MAIVTDLGINNLDTRPIDRHFQIDVKNGKQSVASEPLFLQTNVIKAVYQRDDAKKQASVILDLQLTPRIRSVLLEWEIYHPYIRQLPPKNKANFEFIRESSHAAFVSPIITNKIDYDRLLEEQAFHIDIHLKLRGVKVFKDEDEVDIVSAMREGMEFLTQKSS